MDHGTGYGLLQWTLAPASHGAPIFGSESDHVNGRMASKRLTSSRMTNKFVWLPRCDAVRCRVGVRPILENSTACQKSMPSLISVCIGGLRVVFVGWVFLWLNRN